MQAAVLRRAGRLDVEDVPTPAVHGPGQVLVRNLVSTICGSDLHLVYASPVTEVGRPGYPGHESVGVVADSSDPAVAVDDLVLAVPNLAHAGGFAEYQLLRVRWSSRCRPAAPPRWRSSRSSWGPPSSG